MSQWGRLSAEGLGMKPKFKDPLDIVAYYLKYPKEFVDWLRAQGYAGEFWKAKR